MQTFHRDDKGDCYNVGEICNRMLHCAPKKWALVRVVLSMAGEFSKTVDVRAAHDCDCNNCKEY